MAEWIKKQDSSLYAAYKRLSSALRTHTESEGIEKDIPYKWKTKESRMTISDKTGFKSKTIIRDKVHNIMINDT